MKTIKYRINLLIRLSFELKSVYWYKKADMNIRKCEKLDAVVPAARF
jgi:hypothetical protein